MGGKTNELLLRDKSFCEILCVIGQIIIKDNHIIVCFILCLTLVHPRYTQIIKDFCTELLSVRQQDLMEKLFKTATQEESKNH